jgi:hypothetical protein
LIAEIVSISSDCQLRSRIRIPLRKGTSNSLVVPSKKEIAKLVVVDRIGVWWIGDPEVARN